MAGYHTLSRSLESVAYAPLPGRRLFANAVEHVLNGFVDTDRYQRAGRLAGAKRIPESSLASIVANELCIDMNPFVQCMLRAPSRRGALRVHQSLNQLAALAVRTEVAFNNDGALTVTSRSASVSGEDPSACRDVHLMGMDIILGSIDENGPSVANGETTFHRSRVSPPRRISALAVLLGIGSSVASEAALAFESDSEIRVEDVARRLGCHRRTLQREFKASGITAETLKRACMLSRATSLLPTALTLTEIAHEAGYSDHAHMTRAFVSSCSLSPSILRQAFALPSAIV
jgi:AraC-like DNA-binding protein